MAASAWGDLGRISSVRVAVRRDDRDLKGLDESAHALLEPRPPHPASVERLQLFVATLQGRERSDQGVVGSVDERDPIGRYPDIRAMQQRKHLVAQYPAELGRCAGNELVRPYVEDGRCGVESLSHGRVMRPSARRRRPGAHSRATRVSRRAPATGATARRGRYLVGGCTAPAPGGALGRWMETRRA